MFLQEDGKPPWHWDQILYIDFEPSEGNMKATQSALANLEEFSVTVRVLGAYTQSLPRAPGSQMRRIESQGSFQLFGVQTGV